MQTLKSILLSYSKFSFGEVYRRIYVWNIYVRLTTGPVPTNRPIPTSRPIPTNGPISKSNPTNGPIFPTTRPTFISSRRHFHKWADRNVMRDVSSRQCDEDQTAVYLGRAIIIMTYPYDEFKLLLRSAWVAGITKTRLCNIPRFLQL